MAKIKKLTLNGTSYDLDDIVIENRTFTTTEAGYYIMEDGKSGYKLLAAQKIDGGTWSIQGINNRGNDTYTLIMPSVTAGHTFNVQLFWIPVD